jgi:hypothetical protein
MLLPGHSDASLSRLIDNAIVHTAITVADGADLIALLTAQHEWLHPLIPSRGLLECGLQTLHFQVENTFV